MGACTAFRQGKAAGSGARMTARVRCHRAVTNGTAARLGPQQSVMRGVHKPTRKAGALPSSLDPALPGISAPCIPAPRPGPPSAATPEVRLQDTTYPGLLRRTAGPLLGTQFPVFAPAQLLATALHQTLQGPQQLQSRPAAGPRADHIMPTVQKALVELP